MFSSHFLHRCYRGIQAKKIAKMKLTTNISGYGASGEECGNAHSQLIPFNWAHYRHYESINNPHAHLGLVQTWTQRWKHLLSQVCNFKNCDFITFYCPSTMIEGYNKHLVVVVVVMFTSYYTTRISACQAHFLLAPPLDLKTICSI